MGRGGVAFLIVSVLLAGCIPLSANPVTSQKSATYDQRLTGVWQSTGEGDGSYLTIGRNEGDLDTLIVLTEFRADDELKLTQYGTFSSRVGERSFFNIPTVQVSDSQPPESRDKFILVNYGFVDGDELFIVLPDTKGFSEAIRGKTLEGNVVFHPGSNEIVVTAPSEELAAFLGKADLSKLFDERKTFKKIQ